MKADVNILEALDIAYRKIYLTKPTESGKIANEIEYWTDMPSWPRTSTGGVAHLVQVHGTETGHVRILWNNVYITFQHCINIG